VAQVYSFTDENGVTRLFAEIVPDPAFNGGTITGATTLAPSSDTAVPLTITPPSGAAALFTEVVHVGDGQGHALFGIDAGGDIFFAVTAGGPALTVDAGATASVVSITDGGVSLKAPANSEVQILDTAGDALVRVGGASQTLAFFGTSPAAKPTVTGAKLPSDTVMASLLTALTALGLVTNSTT
jgi:hypothetical protein